MSRAPQVSWVDALTTLGTMFPTYERVVLETMLEMNGVYQRINSFSFFHSLSLYLFPSLFNLPRLTT